MHILFLEVTAQRPKFDVPSRRRFRTFPVWYTNTTKFGMKDFVDRYRPGEKESIEDDIINLRQGKPSRLDLSVVTGLSEAEVIDLADAIPDNIVELRLRHCQQSFVAKVLKRLKETSISTLSLVGNHIDDHLSQGVGELLIANQGLVEINLRQNIIETKGACLIAKGLQIHSTLKRVNLSDSIVDNLGKDALLEAMHHNKSVTVLTLVGKVFRTVPSIQSFGGMLRMNSTLQELDLRSNPLRREEVIEIADALRRENSTLRVLRLSDTNIDSFAAIALGQMLETNMTLTKLDLGGNQNIGFLGAVAIAKGVRTLKHLDLRNTRLGPVGAKALALLIRTNKSLKYLNLSRNNFGDEGAIHVAEALIYNTSLEQLSLSMCSITKTGAVFIGRTLPMMHGIKHLFLYQNPIDEEGSQALLEGLMDNMRLADLGIEKRFMPSCELLSFYLQLNRAGRRALREENVPDAVWAMVLSSFAATNPSALFHLLQQKPDLCSRRAEV